jgi:hypothetical protein
MAPLVGMRWLGGASGDMMAVEVVVTNPMALNGLRWLARLAGVALAGMYLFMISAEILHPHSGPPSHWKEWVGIGLLSLACLAPLVAWKWEFEGAVLSLAALAAFVAMVRFRDFGVPAMISVPALLFLADYGLRRVGRRGEAGAGGPE